MMEPERMNEKVEEYTKYMCIILLAIIIICVVLLVTEFVVGYMTSISIGV